MLRLSAGSRRLSGSEFQHDGPATAKHHTDDQNYMYSDDNARNDQLPLTGGPQMLTTSNVGGWCAMFTRYGSAVPRRPVDQHGQEFEHGERESYTWSVTSSHVELVV